MGVGARSVALLALSATVALGAPQTDSVHRLMEPPPPKTQLPRVSSPVVSSMKRAGLAGMLGQLLSAKSLLLLLPAALAGLAMVNPELMSRLALHVLCFIGSLFEPFDTVLPPKHPLRFFIDQVQHAKRSYEVKHGLVGMRDPMHFFDDEPPVEDGDGDADDADADADSEDGDDDDGDDAGAESGAASTGE